MVKLGNQGLQMRVMDVRWCTIPGTNHAPLVQDNIELATNNPPLMPLALKSRMVEIPLSGSGEGPGWATSRPTLQRHFCTGPSRVPPTGATPAGSHISSPCS
jgi:hypothetical protein